jgi:hypothetical protein
MSTVVCVYIEVVSFLWGQNAKFVDFTLSPYSFYWLWRCCFHVYLPWTIRLKPHSIVIPISPWFSQSTHLWILRKIPYPSEKQNQSQNQNHDQSSGQNWKQNWLDPIPMTSPMVGFKLGRWLWEDSVLYSVVLAGSIVSTGLDLKAARVANITKVLASSRITTRKISWNNTPRVLSPGSLQPSRSCYSPQYVEQKCFDSFMILTPHF